jgi:PAS domain S-box-containing protein
MWSVDPAAGALRCDAIWEAPGTSHPAFARLTAATRFEAGRGLPGRVWESGAPVWIERLRRDANFPRGAAAEADGLASGCAFPVRTPAGIIGVFELFSAGRRSPDPDLLKVMDDIGVQIGLFRQRTRAEEALRESQARFRNLFDSLSDAVIVTDRERRIVEANPAFETMFGWALEEVRGVSIGRLYAAEEDDRAAALALADLDPAGRLVQNAALRRRGGAVFPAEVAVSRLRDGAGAGLGFVGVVRDTTEQRRLEAQLRQAQKMEAVGRLAGGVAHDFNNMLSVIVGYGQMLLRHLPEGDRARGQVAEIVKAADRATGLTRQLLAFGRKQVVQPRVLDLNGVVSNLDKMLHRVIGEDVRLETDLAADLWRVRADPGQIEQVLMNLSVNARDAMPRGGTLRIATRNETLHDAWAREHPGSRPGPHVVIEVSDTGAGIDPEILPHIFEPFFTTKAQGKGTGLGLATVYGIVKQSGGAVYVDSAPGRGAVFRVYLPRVLEALEPVGARPAEGAPRGGSETVLVVEDDPMVRALVQETLGRLGYRVLAAEDPSRALQAAEGHDGTIALLLTDVVMPGMNGRELAGRIARLRPEARVLYMSGYAEDAIAHHGILQEDVVLLQKPFTPDALAGRVREVLDGEARRGAVRDGDDASAAGA